MKKIKRISSCNLPAKPPLFQTVTIYMMLEIFKANDFIYGAFSLLMVIVWVTYIYAKMQEEEVDIFKDK